ncbi:hypothetical protein X975_16739, partial [Stegodyphus mimosarum]
MVVLCCMKFTNKTPRLLQKTDAMVLCWDRVCLVLILTRDCVCLHTMLYIASIWASHVKPTFRLLLRSNSAWRHFLHYNKKKNLANSQILFLWSSIRNLGIQREHDFLNLNFSDFQKQSSTALA